MVGRRGDVYIPEWTLHDEIKVSLHTCGAWRHAWIQDENGGLTSSGQKFSNLTGNRLIHVWQRPDAEGSITLGLQIAVTYEDIQPWHNDEIAPGDVIWCDPPEKDCAAFVSILFVKPTTQMTLMKSLGVVGFFQRGHGRGCPYPGLYS